jgi:hypothetical protein
MDWIKHNPQIIIFALFFLIATLSNRAAAKKAKAEKERRLRPPGAPPTAAPLDEASAQKAQEENRRQVLARMQSHPAPALPRPTPAALTRAALLPSECTRWTTTRSCSGTTTM